MKTLTPREILSLVSIGCAAFAVFAGMVFASDRARRRRVLSPVPPEVELLDQVVYAAGQPQYILLPTSRTPDGEVVTCWKPNFAARLAFLFGARVYVTLLTFNKPLQPMRVGIEKPVYQRA